MVGGGAFGNESAWICEAMRRALRRVRSHSLEVAVVCYRDVPTELQEMLARFRDEG